MFKEFREFAVKGNAIDLAVGVIIGAAFGKVVSSLVSDLIMPPIGLLLGRVDFSNLFLNLGPKAFESAADAKKAGAPAIYYGIFFNTVIEFLIVTFAVFLLIQQINRFRKAPEVTTKACPYCASAIPLAATRCPQCTSQL